MPLMTQSCGCGCPHSNCASLQRRWAFWMATSCWVRALCIPHCRGKARVLYQHPSLPLALWQCHSRARLTRRFLCRVNAQPVLWVATRCAAMQRHGSLCLPVSLAATERAAAAAADTKPVVSTGRESRPSPRGGGGGSSSARGGTASATATPMHLPPSSRRGGLFSPNTNVRPSSLSSLLTPTYAPPPSPLS
jgi:hypothetical protein